MNIFGIDTPTKAAKYLIGRLKQLKTTLDVKHGGAYHSALEYSQVIICTSWSAHELDEWLYRTKGIFYVGVFNFPD